MPRRKSTGPVHGMRRLAALRSEIVGVDRRILALVGRRMHLAERIGRTKSALGLPVRDFRTEREVLARARRRCRALGLDWQIGEELFETLIGGAVAVQVDRPEVEVPRGTGRGGQRRAIVVGGRGRMGSWFARFLRASGHRVATVDPAGPLRGFPAAPLAACRDADLVVLAAPLSRSGPILDSVIRLRPAGLVLDICSLKAPVQGAIRKAAAAGMRIASIHPMFGPSATTLAGRTLLICETGVRGTTAKVRSLFAGTMLRCPVIPLAEHDDLMAFILGLSHAVNVIYASALARSGRRSAELTAIGSTTFDRQARTAADVVRDDARLYYEIQHLNPGTGRALKAVEESLRLFRAAAARGSGERFGALMEAGRVYLAPLAVGGRSR